MFEELLAQLRQEVETADLSAERKAELEAHVAAIAQLGGASEGAADAADGPSGGIAPLRAAVEELEISHPRLTEAVNRIATALSNMGI